MLTLLFTFAAVWTVSLAWLSMLALMASEGWENETGFHGVGGGARLVLLA